MDITQQKKIAACKAVEEIESGMIIGLGTGSTVQFALEKISEKLKSGELKNIYGIPSSLNTEKEAKRLNIPIITLDEALKKRETASVKVETRNENRKSEVGNRKSEIRDQKSEIGNRKSEIRDQRSEIGNQKSEIGNRKSEIGNRKSEIENQKLNAQGNSSPSAMQSGAGQLPIDLTIDGADEFAVSNPDPDLSGEGSTRINLIKGGGGALLREKILAQASKRLIIITDESKRSKYLGEKWPVPIEVIQMACQIERNFLEKLGAATKIRKTPEGNYFLTDEGNFIIDANFGIIKDVKKTAELLNSRAGIVEHGIFAGLANKIICALSNGTIEEMVNYKL